jgi:hypothetical protein
MEVSGHLHVPLETAIGTRYIGDWVGPRANLDIMEKSIVTCYLLTRRIIRGLRIFGSQFIGYTTSGGVYTHL